MMIDENNCVRCPNCGENYNHVKEVVVQLGDDDYLYSDAVLLSGEGGRINVKTVQPKDLLDKTGRVGKSSYRLRDELQTKIVLECETCPAVWEFMFSHHKGCLWANQIVTDRKDKQNPFCFVEDVDNTKE